MTNQKWEKKLENNPKKLKQSKEIKFCIPFSPTSMEIRVDTVSTLISIDCGWFVCNFPDEFMSTNVLTKPVITCRQCRKLKKKKCQGSWWIMSKWTVPFSQCHNDHANSSYCMTKWRNRPPFPAHNITRASSEEATYAQGLAVLN